MAYTPKFRTAARDALWACQCLVAWKAGRGRLPICNLCDTPVAETEPWHESHDPARARCFGGKSVGVAHAACNLLHGRKVVVPALAKSNRVIAKQRGLKGPGRGRYPMRGGVRMKESKTFRHGLVRRRSGAEKHADFLAKRGILTQQPEA